ASDPVVCGLEQDAQPPPSTRHSNVEPGSLELNVNVGVESLASAGGAESIVVSGAVRSIVHVLVAGVPSALAAASVARTSNVWLPSPRAVVVWGLVQELQPPPSTRHSKLGPGSEELKPKLGVASLDGLEGLASMVVWGGVRSTVHVCEAGVGSVLPAWS